MAPPTTEAQSTNLPNRPARGLAESQHGARADPSIGSLVPADGDPATQAGSSESAWSAPLC